MPKLRILLVSDASAAATAANAEIAFRQARLHHDHVDITTAPLPELRPYAAVVLAVEMAEPPLTDNLAAFVTAGGGLLSLLPARADSACDLFGIAPPREPAGHLYSEHHSEGLVFRGGIFPSFAGLELPKGFGIGHAALDILPGPEAEIVARTGVGRPLAWRVRRGKGHVLYWNSAMLAAKAWRGLIIESLAAVMAVSAVPKANVALLQADDFPAPMGVRSRSLLRRSAAMPAPARFYATRWYPDVLDIAARHAFPLTCFAVFCYTWKGEDLLPPVTEDSRNDCFAAFRARGGEVGLHGFNHTPLLASAWGGRDRMTEGLRHAMHLWQEQRLGPPPMAYVPPNNEYDAEGVQALAEAVPSISTICGNHVIGSFDLGGNREYGPEPFAPHLFAFPRASWGSGCIPEVLPAAVAQVAATGVWSHFLHPDDVEDRPRPGDPPFLRRNPEGQSWRSLRRDLSTFLSQMRWRHPWLRGCTTSEGARRLKAHLESDWSIETGPAGLRISGPAGGTIELRLNGDPAPNFGHMTGARTLHEDEGPGFRIRVIELETSTATVETPAPAYPSPALSNAP
ncbi:DUF2194 domain-containing protein [Roseovarius sp.]|uniref:DUF2194 domain-containing protein n=1 Tax=Roseovarius sp. TaxID=1486281 RepID=UPI00263662B6|nr:DUF2194 domain-containing protein [Roseovarius sp.]MDM8167589.1 DUF2194 domain-containing protein [Roseovarius sp.]